MIDAHAHLGSWSKEEFFPVATADWLASYLDLMGFDKLIASSLLAIFYDFHEGNLAVVEATRRYKGRILGYVTVTTSRFLDEAIKEVEEMVTKYGMVGVKIYSTPLYHPVPMPWPEVYYLHIDEPWMYRIVEKAAELEVPVFYVRGEYASSRGHHGFIYRPFIHQLYQVCCFPHFYRPVRPEAHIGVSVYHTYSSNLRILAMFSPKIKRLSSSSISADLTFSS